jgi:hypothetical protein
MKIVKVGARNGARGSEHPTLCVTVPKELQKITGFKNGDSLMVIAEKGKLTYKKIPEELN